MPTSIEAVTTSALSAAMDAAMRRQAVIAANIANANTLGFTPLRVSFGDELAEARAAFREVGRLQAGHVPALHGTVDEAVDAFGVPQKVHLDGEMTELAGNAVQFQSLAQAVSRHLVLLALAAADGRK
jgi:flagellar basal-body rod protein FlgB